MYSLRLRLDKTFCLARPVSGFRNFAAMASEATANGIQPAGSILEGRIAAITVAGFKSLRDEVRTSVCPLTILAGANSSGKSSLVQPLLLLKQTIEASYDPGPLLLDGPNVRFTSSSQFLTKTSQSAANSFAVKLEFDRGDRLNLTFGQSLDGPLDLIEMGVFEAGGTASELRPGMSQKEIVQRVPEAAAILAAVVRSPDAGKQYRPSKLAVSRRRCFLEVAITLDDDEPDRFQLWRTMTRFELVTNVFARRIERLIHVPGLRGNPERTYPVTAVGPVFPGTFEKYAASVVHHWQTTNDPRLHELSGMFRSLGLTSQIVARPVSETETEVQLEVGRLPESAAGAVDDLVSIADVGIGVSQVLPVLVALLAADPGQLVYLEQPELHLHPRAQTALGSILADSANRGVRVIAETHSDLLLRAVQTAIALGQISPADVALHWFLRDPRDGVTTIATAPLDDSGAYGDWPADFSDVYLQAEGAYLDAAEARARVP